MNVGLYLLLTAVGVVISGLLSYLFIVRPRLNKLYSSSNSDSNR